MSDHDPLRYHRCLRSGCGALLPALGATVVTDAEWNALKREVADAEGRAALWEAAAEKRGEYARTVAEAAQAVCWFDWSGNDSDACAAVDKLRAALAKNPTTFGERNRCEHGVWLSDRCEKCAITP